MGTTFNEGLIERSYHTIWERYFTDRFGSSYETFVPGKEEVYVGFDLGFAKAKRNYKYSGDDFFKWMKERIANTSRGDNAFLFAYFFQYKVIKKVPSLSKIRSSTTKSGLVSLGYTLQGSPYRAKLDTTRNTYAKGKKTRPFSQHESLCRVSKIKDTQVFYCTPKFDVNTGIPKEPKRSLADLTLVRINNKTPVFKDACAHYLYFMNISGASPAWCSDPIPVQNGGDALPPKLMTPIQLLKLLKTNFLIQESTSEDEIDYESTQIDEKDLTKNMFSQYLDALPTCTRIVAMWERA